MWLGTPKMNHKRLDVAEKAALWWLFGIVFFEVYVPLLCTQLTMLLLLLRVIPLENSLRYSSPLGYKHLDDLIVDVNFLMPE
jgi:hypothetical protein